MKNNYLQCFFCCIFLIVCTVNAEAQKDSVSEEIIKQIDESFTFNYLQLQAKKEKSNNFALFLNSVETNQTSFFNENELIALKQGQLRSDVGLSITSSYLRNTGAGFLNLEDNLIMRSRFQTGVEIDLLKGGFFENRSKAKTLSYRSKFLNGLQSLGGIEENYSKRLNTIVQLFNRQKIDFLQKRSKLIDVVMRNERSLFHKRLLNKEDVLESQQRNAQIKALMHMYQSFSLFSVIDIDSSFYTKDIDVFDINEELLFKYLKIDNLDSLNYFSAKESSLKSRWLNEISLSAFSRYNYYDMVSNLDRSFYSYGVNLGVPIPFGRTNDLKINKLESLKQLEETVRQKRLSSEEVATELYEFRYKLQQYITLSYKKQTLQEQLRLEDVKRSLKSKYYTPLKALKLMDDFYALEIELLELKQNMYIKLIKIQHKVPEIKLQEMIKPLNLPQILEDESDIHRSMYVWSSVFQTYDANYLFQYLKYHKLNNVLISYQKEDNQLSKKKELITLLTDNQQSCEVMIGNNNLLFETDLPRWFGEVFKQYDNGSIVGYHLDVEPHALKEWKLSQENKDILLNKYIDLLKRSSKLLHSKGLKLTVSIPLHFPVEVVEQIYDLVDGVHFMCYENVGIDYLVRKLTPFKELNDKTNIALRTEDFSSRKEMEELGALLVQLTGCKNLTYHDLNRMIELDKKELKR